MTTKRLVTVGAVLALGALLAACAPDDDAGANAHANAVTHAFGDTDSRYFCPPGRPVTLTCVRGACAWGCVGLGLDEVPEGARSGGSGGPGGGADGGSSTTADAGSATDAGGSGPVSTPDSGTTTTTSWSCARSAYNGAQYWTCGTGGRYRCDAAGTPQFEACPAGCVSRPTGTDDVCASGTTPGDAGTSASWSCARSAYNGAQYWTCSGNARYRCDAAGNVQHEDCPTRCVSQPAGTNDYCL